ncbi:MAG: M16 family metallopeptidase [Caulobacterales bacterium]
MPRTLLVVALILAFVGTAAAAAPVAVPPIAFKTRTLANGLKLLTSVDRTTPNVTVQVWYGVGAKNDPQGRSGFAHLFEHMMFKATRDMPAEYMDRLTEDVGGMNNAFTADDNTAFYEVIPANHLQRLLWAESERLASLVVDEPNFISERHVVEEELRQRVLADPYGRFFRILIPGATFAVHPYKRSAIGSIEDLEAADLDDVRAFHATYYRPDNAALVVVGNFDEAQLNAWVDQYFGPLNNPARPAPQITAVEPARTGSRTVTGYAPNVPLPAVAITWLAPKNTDPDAAALTVVDALLTAGKSSRLYDSLVYDKQIAVQVFSSADLRAQLGMFYVGAVMEDRHTVDEGEAALRAQVARLRDAPVSAAELDSAKTQLLAGEVRARETIDGRANELGQAQVVEGDAARANSDLSDLQKVTAEDVRRVARKYLPDDLRTVVRYLPDSQRAPGAPDALAPPPAVAPTPTPPFTGEVASLAPEGQRAAPPPVGAPVTPSLPTPVERTLPNGLRVIVVNSTALPLVSVDLSFRAGAASDPAGLAGDASLTATLVTEGTGQRSARDIARQAESIGATLSAGSDWDGSTVSLNVMPDRLDEAMPIMADVARNPAFASSELERARKEQLDGLEVGYQEPGTVAALASAPVVYAGTPYGHAQGGSPASLKRLARQDLARFHATYWRPDNAILVLTGDITPERGFALASRAFGEWTHAATPTPQPSDAQPKADPRAVVVDLPASGQAAVVLVKPAIRRNDPRYYQGLVADAVLGGGYSARLNEEIRVKRGLSYGASASFNPHLTLGAFSASAQTKNESAPEVIGLIRQEMGKLATDPATPDELSARTSSLVGEYGRTLATTGGLAGVVDGLARYGIDLNEIKAYTGKVGAVTAAEVQAFARDVLDPSQASVIVVGDAKAFLPALKPATPNLEVVPIDKFDPDSPTLGGGG